jgi:hypothetical protein
MDSATVALWALPPVPTPDGGELERAATATIDALRAQNAIQPWHELDCQIVLDLSRAVTASKGIAKSQMFAALLAARAKLPEPVVTETDDELIEYEAEREIAWVRAHELADPANIQDAEIID